MGTSPDPSMRRKLERGLASETSNSSELLLQLIPTEIIMSGFSCKAIVKPWLKDGIDLINIFRIKINDFHQKGVSRTLSLNNANESSRHTHLLHLFVKVP